MASIGRDGSLPVNQANLEKEHPEQENTESEVGASPEEDNTHPEEFHFTEASHPVQVLSGLNSLRQSESFCDVTICVDGEEFLCHKIVLASFSPYFNAMFAADMAESRQNKVSINGVEPGMIRLLLDYAYTSEVLVTVSNVQCLLSAANLLEVLPVRDACCHFMEKNIDEKNCLGIHCFAEAHACADLQQRAKVYALCNFHKVAQQEEFLNLGQGKLIELISDDELCAENEEIVFNAVMRWLEHDLAERTPDFFQVLECVRLPLVCPYFLHDCVENRDVIIDCPRCRELLEEAKTYQLLQDRRSQLRSPRTRPRKASGTREVIISVGGEDDKVVLRSVESFDPHTQTWKTLACLPFAVSKHGLVVSGTNHLYMAGGELPDGTAIKTVWRYDQCFNSWLEMASMNVPRSELGMAMLDGLVYAVAGWEGTVRLDSVERYSPTNNTWTFVAPMKMAVTSPAVETNNGYLYVTGGAVLEDGDGIDLVQRYNPRTNQWTEMAPMMIARSGSVACVLNGYIYVIGGWHASTENTDKVERFNPTTNAWELRSSMLERRYRPGVAVVDGKIYVCGGEEGWDRYHDTIECYDEEKDHWEIIGEMPTSRSWLSCVAMTISKYAREPGPSCIV